MPARSTLSRRASCRSLLARRRKPCLSCKTGKRPIALRCAGARKQIPTIPMAALTAQSDMRPSVQPKLLALLPRFIGTILQLPPSYSAIKINGERAYDLARDGEAPVLTPRPVTIHALDLIEARSPTRRSSRHAAAREPMSARSPAISAEALAVMAMSAPCGEPASGHSTKRMRCRCWI